MISFQDIGEESLIWGYAQKIKNRLFSWVNHNNFFEPLIYPKMIIINNIQYYNALYLCNTILDKYNPYNPDDSIEPSKLIPIHGDTVAQNIFINLRFK